MKNFPNLIRAVDYFVGKKGCAVSQTDLLLISSICNIIVLSGDFRANDSPYSVFRKPYTNVSFTGWRGVDIRFVRDDFRGFDFFLVVGKLSVCVINFELKKVFEIDGDREEVSYDSYVDADLIKEFCSLEK